MPRKRFSNASLDKPIKVKSFNPPSLINSDKIAAENRKIAKENFLKCVKDSTEKLGVLCEHYGISKEDPNRWFSLSFALAGEYVPGFKVISDKRKTKPNKWTLEKYAALYFAVGLEKEFNPKLTISAICKRLNRSSVFWKSEKSLHKRYSEAVESWLVRMLLNSGARPNKRLCDDLVKLAESRKMQKPSEF